MVGSVIKRYRIYYDKLTRFGMMIDVKSTHTKTTHECYVNTTDGSNFYYSFLAKGLHVYLIRDDCIL